MNIRYDLEKMGRIITDLCVLTGISMAFLDTDQKMLFHYEKEGRFCSLLQRDPEVYARCLCSDDIILNRCFENRRFEWHICHAGLFDAAMPIIKDGIFTGIILMGRVKLEGEALNSVIRYINFAFLAVSLDNRSQRCYNISEFISLKGDKHHEKSAYRIYTFFPYMRVAVRILRTVSRRR